MRTSILIVTLAACGGARHASAPIGNTAAPSAAPTGVRAVDWANRTYVSDGEGGGGYTVTDGYYEFAYDAEGNEVPGDYQPTNPGEYVERGSFSVGPPVYGDVTGDGADEAIIVTSWTGGGTGHFTGISVFGMQGAAPVELGGILGGDRGDGGVADVHLDGAVVIVERYRSGDDDGACCPSQIAHERWRWADGAFVEDEAARTITANDEQ